MRPVFISTVPRRFSRRRLSESAPTTFPSRKVTLTVSSLPRSVSTPVFRCNPISWKMSARLKSRRVPSSAISSAPPGARARRPRSTGGSCLRGPSDDDPPAIDGEGEGEPGDHGQGDGQRAHEEVRALRDRPDGRRQPSDEDGDGDEEEAD